jgi:cytochrome c oxidase assembly protein subunit 15
MAVLSPSTRLSAQGHLQRLSRHLAIATLVLIAIGSATRVMNAGLACPDWPLCYGTLLPWAEMNLRVFLEWFHRLDAALVGSGAIALLALSLIWRKQLPGWVPWLTGLALVLVCAQGALGALTVTELLRFDLVTAHLGLALLFFSLLVGISTALAPQPPRPAVPSPLLQLFAPLAAILVYIQSLLGGLVGSRWAAHQCLSGGQALCGVLNSHLLGVIPATVAIGILGVLAFRQPDLPSELRQAAIAPLGLLGSQILLGIATLRLHLQIEPLTVAHQVTAALLLGCLVSLSLHLRRWHTDSTPALELL